MMPRMMCMPRTLRMLRMLCIASAASANHPQHADIVVESIRSIRSIRSGMQTSRSMRLASAAHANHLQHADSVRSVCTSCPRFNKQTAAHCAGDVVEVALMGPTGGAAVDYSDLIATCQLLAAGPEVLARTTNEIDAICNPQPQPTPAAQHAKHK